MTAPSSRVFDGPSLPPPGGSKEFSLDLWDATRNRAIEPRWAGPLDDSPELRREFLVGARLMGYELIDLDDPAEHARLKAMRPRRKPLQPQQLLVADALNAGRSRDVVEMPRRSSKTTSIFIWMLGRMHEREEYITTFSAQNGKKGMQRLREWKRTLDRITPDPLADVPYWRRNALTGAAKRHAQAVALFGDDMLPPAPAQTVASGGRGFTIMMGAGNLGIYFDNGSQMLVLKPDADDYRGEGADVSWIDEGQEIDPEEGSELLAGILPLQDTRVDSKVIVSGTAGEVKAGVLWSFLTQLRAGAANYGGVDFAAPEDTPWEVIADEEAAMALLERVHPGIGTLTTIEKMRENYRDPELTLPQWAREYLNLWPERPDALVVDPQTWADLKLEQRPQLPARVAFGFAVKPRGGSGAIAAAWRDRDGIAHVAVVGYQRGTDWMPREMSAIGGKYTTTFGHDRFGDDAATATAAERVRGRRPRLQPLGLTDKELGCIQLLRDIEAGTLRHGDQRELNQAIHQAARRRPRGSDEGRWVFTPIDEADLSPLDACVMALRNWDKHYARRATQTRRGVRTAA